MSTVGKIENAVLPAMRLLEVYDCVTLALDAISGDEVSDLNLDEVNRYLESALSELFRYMPSFQLPDAAVQSPFGNWPDHDS